MIYFGARRHIHTRLNGLRNGAKIKSIVDLSSYGHWKRIDERGVSIFRLFWWIFCVVAPSNYFLKFHFVHNKQPKLCCFRTLQFSALNRLASGNRMTLWMLIRINVFVPSRMCLRSRVVMRLTFCWTIFFLFLRSVDIVVFVDILLGQTKHKKMKRKWSSIKIR